MGRAIRIVHAVAIAATLVVDAVLIVYSLTIIGSNAAEAVTGVVVAPVLAILGGLSVPRPRGAAAVAFIVAAALFGILLSTATSGAWPWAIPYLVASVTGLVQYRSTAPSTPPVSDTPNSRSASGSP